MGSWTGECVKERLCYSRWCLRTYLCSHILKSPLSFHPASQTNRVPWRSYKGSVQHRRSTETFALVTQAMGGAPGWVFCSLAQSSLKNQTSTTSPRYPILKRYNPDVFPDRQGSWRLNSQLQSQEVGRSECQFQPWVCFLTSYERLNLRTN